jgi:MFS family permease
MSSTAVIEPVSIPEPEAAPRGKGRHLGIALTVITAAQLMVVLDGTIVNIAMPHIMTDLGFTQENLSWVVTAYTLAFGGLLLLGGRLGDLFGRRKVFMTGVLVFAGASLLGGLAQTEGMLLGARALQGIGAAFPPRVRAWQGPDRRPRRHPRHRWPGVPRLRPHQRGQ